jgi:hypothetical protein
MVKISQSGLKLPRTIHRKGKIKKIAKTVHRV